MPAGSPFQYVEAASLPVIVQNSLDYAQHFNELYSLVASDPEFLLSSLADVPDPFTQSLLKIYKKVLKEGCKSKDGVFLNAQRADYMIHVSSDGSQHLKQVEVNSVACSFAGLSTKLLQLHHVCLGLVMPHLEKHLPTVNPAVDVLAEGIVKAHHAYAIQGSIVLFLVDSPSRNVFDQRHLEYAVRRLSDHSVGVVRLKLIGASEHLSLSEERKLLYGPNQEEVSVVYFRAGYDPQDYTSKEDWSARLLIERSQAVKVPSIAFHLAGAKKIQQVLAEPGMVERYIHDQATVDAVRSTFMGMHPAECQEARDALAERPSDYVLKPQREGGGNNVYGDDIPAFYSALSDSEKAAYILMERINPPTGQAYLIHPQGVTFDPKTGNLTSPLEPVETISELGSFGYAFGRGVDILENESGGYLLRTKSTAKNEGGVMAGASVLDTPYLV